ncbi:MAG: hypothetical protein IJK85_00455 [Bacteroidales bacterium]|nr:hypothetical protein [Bacteroidales bacterium]
MRQDQLQKIDKLLLDYGKSAKPLINEIAQRHYNSKVPENLLNEIRALNDHIARCYRDGADDNYIDSELGKAEGHLRRLMYDCFKQLNIYISDNLKRRERRSYSNRWLYRDGGNFWRQYTEWKQQAQSNVIEAKKQESINSDAALKHFESGYQNYRNIEELFKANRRFLCFSFFFGIFSKAFHGIWWIVSTILISVVAVLIEHFVL